ncbi:Unknown protein [Striga hermonthica]|uniref:Uncharacterized protein n=1 Tax=Striga hermonthica TaxID=68872 RepID=A0A9N7NF75_STRHE|nr:Unknown protein [Striga hermonthica]
MGKGIMKEFQACGKKMKVTVDPSIGRPKSRDESSKFSSQIGVVTRDVLLVPVRWKDVDEEKDLQPGIDHIKIHMDINLDDPTVKCCVIDRVQASSRQKRDTSIVDLSCDDLGIFPVTGRLGCSLEGAGKRHIFAIGNYIKQRLLKPIHQWLARVLKLLPADGTFDQTKPLGRLEGASH